MAGMRRHRWRRRVLIGIGSVLVLLAWYVMAMAAFGARQVVLPALTGKYQVGRTGFEWVDTGRTDPLDPHHGPRRLSVWLWYPAPADAQESAQQSAQQIE